MTVIQTLDGLITRDSELHNGRPVVAGTGVTVRAIAIMYKQGLSPEDISDVLPLSLAQVYAALNYDHLNTGEIEADILADSEDVLIKKCGSFDNHNSICYKIAVSPLFLRGQGARRCITASAFLN